MDPGIKQVHCIPDMWYEATKGPGIEEDHCILGMSHEATKSGPTKYGDYVSALKMAQDADRA